MKMLRTLGAALAFVLAASCAATIPPAELTSARAEYERASTGPAASLNPADLHTAKQSLDAAERSFKDDGDNEKTKDLAYAAQRIAATAAARARAMLAIQQRDQTLAQQQAAQTAKAQQTTTALAKANEKLSSQGQQLAIEKQRREEAEKRAAQAAADLAKIATVKQETRGMVITLSGSVLFASGKSELLPAAQAKLSEVANALTKQDPDSKIVVEGHTDSQGAAAFNQDLSQKRAESVRMYLVSHGIAADRIAAQGFGSTRPVADNANAEGRANNRRVEIVVQPTSGSSSS